MMEDGGFVPLHCTLAKIEISFVLICFQSRYQLNKYSCKSVSK